MKRPIPDDVWRGVRCLIVHPGPPGDRGPAALDRAILEGVAEWGVTVLQADGEFDAGPIWVLLARSIALAFFPNHGHAADRVQSVIPLR